MDTEENTMPTHECTGDDCQHEGHAAATPVADASTEEAADAPAEEGAACKACAGEEGAEHTCGM